MKLICIGIGGTGAACIETVVHLAALGLFPDGCELVPVVIDPDRQHPRITGMTSFLNTYTELRNRGSAKEDFNRGGLFGTAILRKPSLNVLRPASQENLFGLLGIANPRAKPLARLFFQEHEIGEPGSHEFANGYYGRANAGVCFFSDPAGKEAMLGVLRDHLKSANARVVVFGSVFGGTGAAGLLHVARTIRKDPQLRAFAPKIAVVQLESYFEPDPSQVGDTAEFVNLPETFERRTGAAYQFLSNLATNDNLDFDELYLLGVPAPEIFPPEWFKRDQQDNPHLFLEYLAAMAARDFVLNPPDDGPTLKIRAVPSAPFGEPLDTLRRLLYGAAVTYPILQNFVVPLLRSCGSSDVRSGHPWIHDLHQEMIPLRSASSNEPPSVERSSKEMLEHFEGAVVLLREILGHAGILESEWRTEGTREVADDLRARHVLMSTKTRSSFPAEFVPHMERFDPRGVLAHPNPSSMFETYDRAIDAGLPVRALYRWAMKAISLTQPETPRSDTRKHQLVQQEDRKDQTGQVLSLPNVPDNAFHEVNAKEVLQIMARATWKSPGRHEDGESSLRPMAYASLRETGASHALTRDTSEYPSVWAPALIYRDLLKSKSVGDRTRYIHLGLLWVALMKWEGHQMRPPIHEFKLDVAAKDLSAGFRDAIRSTSPLSQDNYKKAVSRNESIFALYRDTLTGPMPSEDDVLGFLYPDTVIVPAPGLSDQNAEMLYDIGRYVAGRHFPQLLLDRLTADWVNVLGESEVPNFGDRGSEFINFLKGFDDSAHGEMPANDEMHAAFPFDTAAPWIHRLYRTGD